jgi:hypothetical protein
MLTCLISADSGAGAGSDAAKAVPDSVAAAANSARRLRIRIGLGSPINFQVRAGELINRRRARNGSRAEGCAFPTKITLGSDHLPNTPEMAS